MNKSLRKALLGAGFAAASLLTLSAAAGALGLGGGVDHDPGRMLAHIADRLDLSEEQQAEVGKVLDTTRDALAADRQRLKELRSELHAQRENFDAGETQAAADEVGQITARMVYQATSTFSQVYQLMTPEQRQQMDSMMEKRHERRARWRRHGGAPQEE
ncbi:MAG: periplasmic heavy metal sensor [Haliea sp.]|jgi:Spy/CpxP family protein refolding chaperone|nr:periplasmic heavy metal sensor [Haliea sp.]